MKVSNVLGKRTTRDILVIATAAALVLAFVVALPQPAQADQVTPPSVPANLQAPEGNKVFLMGHATGTQNYICLPAGSGFGWTFFGPQATLFNDTNEQSITHFLSPNPLESNTPRATWQHSKDTSSVWAVAIGSSTDPNFVASGAIPWLLLEVVGSQAGPTGGDRLVGTTYIQRVNTTGGVAPSTGCAGINDVGRRALVPYTADYFLYR